MSAYETKCPSHFQEFRTLTWRCLSNNNKYYHFLLYSIGHVPGAKSFTFINAFNLHNNPTEVGIIIIP